MVGYRGGGGLRQAAIHSYVISIITSVEFTVLHVHVYHVIAKISLKTRVRGREIAFPSCRNPKFCWWSMPPTFLGLGS